MLTGIKVVDEDTCRQAADKLIDQGIDNVIITLGKQGAYYKTKDGICELVPGTDPNSNEVLPPSAPRARHGFRVQITRRRCADTERCSSSCGMTAVTFDDIFDNLISLLILAAL